MPTRKPLKIAMIGVADLADKVDYRYDPMLFHAFMLMALNLNEATYQRDNYGFDYTPPLQFDFIEHPLLLIKHPTKSNIAITIQKHLLPHVEGVIVNLRGSISSKNQDPLTILLTEVIDIVYQANLPTVFANQSIGHAVPWPPKLGDEVTFPPMPAVLQSVEAVFPRTVPILRYGYSKPSSIQTILTTLIAEIENHSDY